MNSLTLAFEYVSDGLFAAADHIERGILDIQDSVCQVLDAHLHPKIAYVVKNALTALPLTLALQFVPEPIPFGLITTFGLISVIVGLVDGNLGNVGGHVISTGIGMHYMANAITKLAAFIFTPNLATGISFALTGLLGLLWIPVPRNT